MKIRLRLGSALLIFITSMANAFAYDLEITNDGTATGGNIEVYNSSQTLVGSCSLPAGCDASLTTLPGDFYTIVAIPTDFTTDVTDGFSACPLSGTVVGNTCGLFLELDVTATATFNLRNRFTVYDQDADGIDDLTEFALDKNPLFRDGENPDGSYLDADSDGLPDIIETQITKTDINTNDSATCSGTPPAGDDLTGQWDVRWVEGDSITAGHDLNDGDDVDTTDTKKEWVAAFSICHTNTDLKIFDQFFGYATSASFDGTTLNATFAHAIDGDTTLSATYTAGGGAFTKGRFQDLNVSLEGTSGAQMRADRRMTKAELSNLTAANISGTYAVQATIYDSASDQLFDKPYNPGTIAVDFRATETAGKVMTVNLYSTGDSGNANAIRGYFVPSVASYFSVDRSIAVTNIDLDGDTLADDQLFDHSQVSMTFVEAPASGVGGMFRGELESQELKDIDSDFTNDGIYGGSFGNLYGERVEPKASAFTLNIEKTDGTTVVKNRITLLNTYLSAETATYDTPTTTGNPLFDNLDGNPATNSSIYYSTNNALVGYADGERVGSHPTNDNNGTNLSIKPEDLGLGNSFNNGTYTFNFTGDQLGAGSTLSVDHTKYNANALPIVTNIKLDNRTLKRSLDNARLINSDSTHIVKWTATGPSGLTGSTGANLYRVQIGKVNDTIGIDDSGRLEMYVSCSTGTCEATLPKDTFDPNSSYSIRILAFDTPNRKNRSISANYYVSAASATTGCSINSDNSGGITNASPCAEYYQVQNPRKTGNLVTDSTTFLDYAVNRPVGTPKAIVVLLAGGQGYAGVIGNPTTQETKQIGINSLTRSAEMFAEQGYLAVTIDRPSDEPNYQFSYEFDNYRISPRHAHDIASVLNEVNTQNLNVFLAGTSRGGISVLNQFKVANAISMSVPVNSNASGYVVTPGSHPVGQISDGEINPADIYVPVHYLINPDETCSFTVPSVPTDPAMFNSFANNSGQNQMDSVFTASNGVSNIGTNTCGSTHDHGFLGSELSMVTTTTNWFDGIITSYAGNRPPVTRPARQLAKPGVDTIFPVGALAAVASDPDGDPIDVEIGTNVTILSPTSVAGKSTRGADYVADDTGLTYTPPAGANNITDAITFVVTDNNGGRTSMVMTIDISDDVDNDGLPDSIYPADGSTADAASDTDGDGLTLLQEYQSGTNAAEGDTDGDGFSDSFEILNGLNPTAFNDPNFDSDSDGFTDGEEAAVGSNLFDASINPGFISLTDATPSVQEDVGTANISVTRSGGSFGEVSVLCSTSDIVDEATAGTDYTAISTTLTWLNGDATPKSCNIDITADAETEGPETFQLDISNPTGGAKLAP